MVHIVKGGGMRKRDPQISDLNDSLESDPIIDTPQWRFIQHLGDVLGFAPKVALVPKVGVLFQKYIRHHSWSRQAQ